MKPGTIIRLSDGREGTVVYHGLDGYGIRWGRHVLSSEVLHSIIVCNGTRTGVWAAEAMLRKPYEGCDPDLEYVGDEWETVNTQPEGTKS